MTKPKQVTARLDEIEQELLTAQSMTGALRDELTSLALDALDSGDFTSAVSAVWMREARWGDRYTPAHAWTPKGAKATINSIVIPLANMERRDEFTPQRLLDGITMVVQRVAFWVPHRFIRANYVEHQERAMAAMDGWLTGLREGTPLSTSQISVLCRAEGVATFLALPAARRLRHLDKLGVHFTDAQREHVPAMLERLMSVTPRMDLGELFPAVIDAVQSGVTAEEFDAWVTELEPTLRALVSDDEPIYDLWLSLLSDTREHVHQVWVKHRAAELREELARIEEQLAADSTEISEQ